MVIVCSVLGLDTHGFARRRCMIATWFRGARGVKGARRSLQRRSIAGRSSVILNCAWSHAEYLGLAVLMRGTLVVKCLCAGRKKRGSEATPPYKG
jgi:hypothetical protein